MLGTEILNADSRQVYRDMVIGTAQPTATERAAVRHHMIDCQPLDSLYSAGQFEKDGLEWLENWFTSHRVAVMVGGSGLYIKAILEGLDAIPGDIAIRSKLQERLKAEGLGPLQEELALCDPVHFAKMDASNPQRVIRALEVCLASGKPFSSFHSSTPKKRPFDTFIVGMEMNRELLEERINGRVINMVEAGLEDEARRLHPKADCNALQTVGYQEWFEYFDGKRSRERAIGSIQTHTRQFAKRQMTWFRRMQQVHWFDANDRTAMLDEILAQCSQRGWLPPQILGENDNKLRG